MCGSQLNDRSIASSNWIQSIFWKLNRFDRLKDTPYLDEYEIRLDPSVWPKHNSNELASASTDLPAGRPRALNTNYYTSADYHELYKSGKTTPSDVVEQLLPLIRRETQPTGEHSVAFIDSKVDLVRAAARASTERYKAGKPMSELDGVPLAIKDEVDLKGYKTTKGSKLDFTDKTGGTSWCVQKWQDAGAVIIGKTNMHEVGLDTTNNNQICKLSGLLDNCSGLDNVVSIVAPTMTQANSDPQGAHL